jgi:hypothetical protein
MTKKGIDELIAAALDEDERAILARMGEEPGFLPQAIATFRGPLGWVVWFAYLVQMVAFAGFVYAGWRFYGTTDVIAALRWGFAALVLVGLTYHFKGAMGTHGQTNRVLREIKRLELRLTRLQAGGDAGRSA